MYRHKSCPQRDELIQRFVLLRNDNNNNTRSKTTYKCNKTKPRKSTCQVKFCSKKNDVIFKNKYRSGLLKMNFQKMLFSFCHHRKSEEMISLDNPKPY